MNGWQYRWTGKQILTVQDAQRFCWEELRRQDSYLNEELRKLKKKNGHFRNSYKHTQTMLEKHYSFSFKSIYYMSLYSNNKSCNVNLFLQVMNDIGNNFRKLWNILSLIACRDVIGIYKILRNVLENSFGEKSEYEVRKMFEELK